MYQEPITAVAGASAKKMELLGGSLPRYLALSMLAGAYVGLGIAPSTTPPSRAGTRPSSSSCLVAGALPPRPRHAGRLPASSTATTRPGATAAARCSRRSTTSRSLPPEASSRTEPRKPSCRIASEALKRTGWYWSAGRCHAQTPIRKPPRFRGKPRPYLHVRIDTGVAQRALDRTHLWMPYRAVPGFGSNRT